MLLRIWIFIGCLSVGSFVLRAEELATRWQGGVRLGGLHAHSDLADGLGLQGYVFARYSLHRYWLAEWDGGYGRYNGGDYSTDLWLGDTKVLFQPGRGKPLVPFFYGGIGTAYHSIHQLPKLTTPGAQLSGWTVTIPVGVGTQVYVNDHLRLELSGGYTYTFRDDLNGAMLTKGNDTFFNWTVGFVFGHFGWKRKSVVAQPTRAMPAENPDDDGDGLSDMEELLFYNTNPDMVDSDGDGLSDFDEVRIYFTNPRSLDSDGDGLMDDEEVRVYKTNPHMSDTDGDGLSDGLEVAKYRTDPTRADTDGDGVRDGEEVFQGRDPLTANGSAVVPTEEEKK